jgi:hypothetical protein
MTFTTERIHDLEQAKKYFIAMGCSHFHMFREYPQRAKEYQALDIDPQIESEWIKEEFEKTLENFHTVQPSEYGSYLKRLNSIIERKEFYLEKLLELVIKIQEKLPFEQIGDVLSSLIGNDGTKSKGGLIQKSYDLQRKDLAGKFYAQVKLLFKKAADNSIKLTFDYGNLLDVIEYFKIDECDEYLIKLREKNDTERFEYFKSGAKEGNKYSMNKLSECYREGKACEMNIEKANFWASKANEK